MLDQVAVESEFTVPERWVPPQVIAEHLALTRETVVEMARAGRLPATKIGAYWRFKLSEVDAAVRSWGG